MTQARALELFDQLADLDREARETRLSALVREDPALAAAVRRMLAADASASGVLDRALIDAVPPEASPPDRSGQRVGAYRLAARIGRGGMGEVYRAERETEGYAQTVAIKLLRRGLDSDDIVGRFVQERRILARLEHPGIARLIDGGMSADGLPWLAMELVDGVPITQFAGSHGLDLRARVTLLAAVCDALDYAHRRLIVHRDLKPSNVLVGADGAPRLLDFGIAKLLDQPDGESLTGTGVRVLSPAYAAPEQLAGDPIGIATDVYALGLLLYELLTGELPHGRRDGAGAMQTRDLVAEPMRPSASIRRSAGHETTITARQLEGDLDTIVLKALAHEPDRRYASAAALADDLRRHLDGHPIAARPDTLSYRVGKFVRRNRGGVVASLVILMALFAALGIALWQARIARQEAARAEVEATTAREMTVRARQVKDFLISAFAQEDPLRRDARGPLTMAEAFDDTLKRIDSELASDPAMQGELLDDFGEIVANKGDLVRAQTLFERALANAERAHGPDDPAVAESLINLGVIASMRGDVDHGRPHLERAVAILERSTTSDPHTLANALEALATALHIDGETTRASELLRRSLPLYCNPDATTQDCATSMANLAVMLVDAGNYAEAEPLARRAMGVIEAAQGVDSPALFNVIGALEIVARNANRLDEEQQLGERRLAIIRKEFAGDHPWKAGALAKTGWFLSRSGQYAPGEARILEGLDMFVRLGVKADKEFVAALHWLAMSQELRGDLADARVSLDRAVEHCRAGAMSNLTCLATRAHRAKLHIDIEDPALSLTEIDAVIALLKKNYSATSEDYAQALEGRAAALLALKRKPEAVASLREAIAIYHTLYGADREPTQRATKVLAAIEATAPAQP